jgi:hypothetical protein
MNDAPPFGKSWNRLYAMVLIVLAIDIAIFYAFTKVFS